MLIDKVMDRLFISGATPVLRHPEKLRDEYKITHILTVSVMPIPSTRQLDEILYKCCHLMDMPNQDLLSCLDECLSFIVEALDDENCSVLVHCEMGVSRSASVVTAYLMLKFEWSVTEALAFIQRSRFVMPNDGFLEQLAIFEKLKYRADNEALRLSIDYRRWCSNSGRIVPNSKGPATVMDFTTAVDNATSASTVQFKCAKCRRLLFTNEHVYEHHRANTNEICGFGLFIAPMKWMTLDRYQDKVSLKKN